MNEFGNDVANQIVATHAHPPIESNLQKQRELKTELVEKAKYRSKSARQYYEDAQAKLVKELDNDVEKQQKYCPQIY